MHKALNKTKLRIREMCEDRKTGMIWDRVYKAELATPTVY